MTESEKRQMLFDMLNTAISDADYFVTKDLELFTFAVKGLITDNNIHRSIFRKTIQDALQALERHDNAILKFTIDENETAITGGVVYYNYTFANIYLTRLQCKKIVQATRDTCIDYARVNIISNKICWYWVRPDNVELNKCEIGHHLRQKNEDKDKDKDKFSLMLADLLKD